jgi:hypothetical protein
MPIIKKYDKNIIVFDFFFIGYLNANILFLWFQLYPIYLRTYPGK